MSTFDVYVSVNRFGDKFNKIAISGSNKVDSPFSNYNGLRTLRPTFRLFPCNLLILLMVLFQNRTLHIYNYLFLLIIFETSEM